MDRRRFNQAVAATGLGMGFFGSTSTPANSHLSPKRSIPPFRKQKIRLAQIGAGGQGTSLAQRFHRQKDVEVVYVCDPDQARRNKTVKSLGGRPNDLTVLFRLA